MRGDGGVLEFQLAGRGPLHKDLLPRLSFELPDHDAIRGRQPESRCDPLLLGTPVRPPEVESGCPRLAKRGLLQLREEEGEQVGPSARFPEMEPVGIRLWPDHGWSQLAL